MDWILDNIRLVVIVGGAIAYWLNQRRKAKEAELASRTQMPAPPQAQGGDETERIRRIQEEIRRKILERTDGLAHPPLPMVQVPQPPPLARPQPKQAAYMSLEESRAESDKVILEQQEQLATKLRELEEKRREHMSRAETFAEKTAETMGAAKTAVRGSILADLRNPVSVRRAIVLREVLGTPVGLR